MRSGANANPFGNDKQNLCRYEALRDDALPLVMIPFF